MNRIQMVGTQRSGSNLLRLMLAQGSVFAPPSAHVLRDLRFLADGREYDLSSLVTTACGLLDRNVLGWPAGSYSVPGILSRVRHHSLAGVVVALYDCAASHMGQPAWVQVARERSLSAPTAPRSARAECHPFRA